MHNEVRRWVALLAALLCALPLAGLASPAAAATRPAKAGIVWMTHQVPRTGPAVSLRVEWARVSRASVYEIEYAPASGSITTDEVQRSRSKKVKRLRGTSRNLQAVMIDGLKPGTTYCFQVRGQNSAGYGYRGGPHCKVTVRAARFRPAASTPLVVGTFNTCSNACASSLGTSWSVRGPLVRKRILEMNAGSAPVDVVAIQEGNLATSYLRDRLDGFSQGCETSDGSGHANDDNQSVFVRDDTWEVVPGTRDGLSFENVGNDPAHGACWVKIRSLATQQEVVVVGLHLIPRFDTTGDSIRAQQTDLVADAVTSDFPGETIVYAGDFNSTRSRTTDAPLKRLYADGQDDAYDQALRYLSRPTRNSACGTTTTIRNSWTWGDHVDRVFAPAGVHVANWKVDYRLDGSRYASPMASDHNPVVVSLLIPARV